MFLAAQESGSVLATEIVLWTLPMALAVHLARTSGRGRQAVWILIATACMTIVLDKYIDLHHYLHDIGSSFVIWADPEHRFRGPTRIYRVLLLGGIFLLGCVGVYSFSRRDEALDRNKGLSLAGITLLMAFLGLRLIPALKPWFESPVNWLVELGCLSCVLVGELAAWTHLRRLAVRGS